MALKVTFTTSEIYDYLRVDPGYDTNIVDGLQAAVLVEAEEFLNTDFSETVTNADGTTTTIEHEAPATVKEWVKSRIAQLYEGRGQSVKPDYTLLKSHRISSFRG